MHILDACNPLAGPPVLVTPREPGLEYFVERACLPGAPPRLLLLTNGGDPGADYSLMQASGAGLSFRIEGQG